MYNDFATFPHPRTPSTPAHPFTRAVASSYHDALIRAVIAITAVNAIISSYRDALMRGALVYC